MQLVNHLGMLQYIEEYPATMRENVPGEGVGGGWLVFSGGV